MEVDFQVTGTEATIAAMRSVLASVSGAENRLKIARAGVPFIQDAARASAPIFKGPTGEHYLYDTPKLLKRLRAPNGQGRIKTIYQAGNTAVAIQDLSDTPGERLQRPGLLLSGLWFRRSKAKGAAWHNRSECRRGLCAFHLRISKSIRAKGNAKGAHRRQARRH
jgi:hypothetical protein